MAIGATVAHTIDFSILVQDLPPSIPSELVDWYQRGLIGWSADLAHRMHPASHCAGQVRVHCLYNSKMKWNSWHIYKGLINDDHFILYLFTVRMQLFIA